MSFREAFKSTTGASAVLAALVGAAIVAASLSLSGDLTVDGDIIAGSEIEFSADNTAPNISTGAADPDGVVSAIPGSLRLRENGASSALYVNTSAGPGAGTDWTAAGAASTSAPTQSSTGFSSWWYQYSSSSKGDGASGVYVRTANTAGTFKLSALAKAVPSLPFTITMRISAQCPLVTSASAGPAIYVGWSEAATGDTGSSRALLWYYKPNQGTFGHGQLTLTDWDTVAVDSALSGNTAWSGVQWVRIVDDNSGTVFWYVSPTGDANTWIQVNSAAKASYLGGASGFDYLIFGAVGSTGECVASITSYEQT